MLEGKIQKEIVKAFRADGWLAWKFTSQFRRSVPDYFFLKNGFPLFIEFKATGVPPSDAQVEEHKKIRAKGGLVYVCDDIDLGLRILEEVRMYT